MGDENGGRVAFAVEPPVEARPRFERGRILLRLVLWLVLSWLMQLGIWLVPPVVTALLVARDGGRSFLARHAATYVRWLGIYLGLNAFLLFATDELPDGRPPGPVRLEVRTAGEPSVASSLLRILWVLPHAVVLVVLGWLAALLALIAVVTVLVDRRVPAFVRIYQEGFLAWKARALAYYASLVEAYPPFSLAVEPPARPAPVGPAPAGGPVGLSFWLASASRRP